MLRLRNLSIAILLTLPFTKSLTLPVSFSLKIYEPLVLVALAAAFAEGPVTVGRDSRVLRWWILFWLLSLFSTAWGYQLVTESNLAALEWAVGRYDPTVNAVLHSFYLALDILTLAVFLICLERGALTLREFLRAWLWGAMLATAYAVVLNLVHWAGLPYAVALRFYEVQTASVAGIEFVRSGPFEEGNFYGLYLVLSLSLALWAGSRYRDRFFYRSVPVLALGIFISSSPAAMALMILLLAGASLRPGVPAAVRLVELVLAVALIGIVLATDLLQVLVLDKFSLVLYGGVTDSGNISLVRRFNEMYHAWRQVLDHPWGVGIGNFGYFWGDHPEFFPWLQVEFTSKKQIPNNVYLEILCEQGIQGLVIFLFVLGSLASSLWHRRESFLLLSLFAMMAYFIVFPTFRLAFLWVFWAFLVYVTQHRSPARASSDA